MVAAVFFRFYMCHNLLGRSEQAVPAQRTPQLRTTSSLDAATAEVIQCSMYAKILSCILLLLLCLRVVDVEGVT